MTKQKKLAHEARLAVALAIASHKGGSREVKQKVLNGICKKDSVVARILKTYGVKV